MGAINETAGAPAEIARAAPEARQITYGTQLLYCTIVVGQPDMGECFVDAARCDADASKTTNGLQFGPCEARTAGACFTDTIVITGAEGIVCAPSITSCEQTLGWMRKHPLR